MKHVVIRLQRRGRYKQPCYNVVVMFKKNRVQGATLDKIGFYNPLVENKMFFISFEKLAWWLYKGATVSPRVQVLIGRLSSGFLSRRYHFKKGSSTK